MTVRRKMRRRGEYSARAMYADGRRVRPKVLASFPLTDNGIA